MINAGAIITCSLLKTLIKPEMTLAEKFDYTLSYFRVSNSHTVNWSSFWINKRHYRFCFHRKCLAVKFLASTMPSFYQVSVLSLNHTKLNHWNILTKYVCVCSFLRFVRARSGRSKLCARILYARKQMLPRQIQFARVYGLLFSGEAHLPKLNFFR